MARARPLFLSGQEEAGGVRATHGMKKKEGKEKCRIAARPRECPETKSASTASGASVATAGDGGDAKYIFKK
jgi:hypothetical protein